MLWCWATEMASIIVQFPGTRTGGESGLSKVLGDEGRVEVGTGRVLEGERVGEDIVGGVGGRGLGGGFESLVGELFVPLCGRFLILPGVT